MLQCSGLRLLLSCVHSADVRSANDIIAFEGRFREPGTFAFSVAAVDAGEQTQTMENFIFDVRQRGTFRVMQYSRGVADVGAPEQNSASRALDCVVNASYRIDAINLETLVTANADDDTVKYTFTLKNAPGGFFIAADTGEILGVPTEVTGASGDPRVAALFAVDSSGTEAWIEDILITVKEKPRFVLVTRATSERAREGGDFTDPNAKGQSYFVGENYVVAPLKVNETATVVSSGMVKDIKYTLVNAPETVFISADTGVFTGKFNTVGVYTFSVAAIDAGGQLQTLESFTFDVVERGRLKINGFDRVPAVAHELDPAAYSVPTDHADIYAVGTTVRFGAIAIVSAENTNCQGDFGSCLAFTMEGAPSGFLLDPADGFVQGMPTASSAGNNYTMQFYAVDKISNQKALLQSIGMNVKYADVDVISNGPNNVGCENGDAVDAIAFDNSFSCDCSGTVFDGANCETKAAAASASSLATNVGSVAGGLIGGMVVLLAIIALVYKQRVRLISMRAHDFALTLQQMTDKGEIAAEQLGNHGLDTHNLMRCPREIKRANVTMISKIGAGAFGDVWKGVLDESKSGGVPGYEVAIKTVNQAGGDGEEDLVKEATVMAMVPNHDNIVPLIGVVTSGVPLYLIVPLCEHGSMLAFLKKRLTAATGQRLTVADKITMATDVARGMDHLVSCHFIHRDLAARNVLVNSIFVCRVADFGLSRAVASKEDGEEEQYYRSARGQFPVRWTAPYVVRANLCLSSLHFPRPLTFIVLKQHNLVMCWQVTEV